MRKRVVSVFITALVLILTVSGCGAAAGSESSSGPSKVSFEAYITEGETFTFEFDPTDAVAYEALRDAEFRDSLSLDNWDKYFSVRELHLEHMEYDETGNETATYMKGDAVCLVLKDDYYYVDNYSRNGVEFSVYVKGTETRVMKNDGVTYDPVTTYYDAVRSCSGGDIMLILSDFTDSWDETTVETFTGSLESYEVLSAAGELFLIDSSLIEFRHFRDDIYYFAAYGAEDDYFVIFIKTNDAYPDPLKEYEGAVYSADGNAQPYRYTGFRRIVISEMLIECLKQVNR